MSNKLEIYTKPNCPYCIRLKLLLQRNSIPFEERNVFDDVRWFKFWKSKSHKLFPQIYVGHNLFVDNGCEGFEKLSLKVLKEKLAYFGIKIGASKKEEPEPEEKFEDNKPSDS